jgi:hypothetical protein
MNCWQTNKLLLFVPLWMLVQHMGHAQTHFVAYTGMREIEMRKGKEEMIRLSFAIHDDFYIQAHQLENEFFIPTDLRIIAPEGIAVGEIRYPAGIKYHYTEEDAMLDIYTNTIEINVPVRVTDSAAGTNDLKLQGSLYYQACSKVKCYFPRNLDFTIRISLKP